MAKAMNINLNVDFTALIAKLQEVIDAVDDLNDTLEANGYDRNKVWTLVDKNLNDCIYRFQAPAEGRAPQFDPEEGWVPPLLTPIYPKDDES